MSYPRNGTFFEGELCSNSQIMRGLFKIIVQFVCRYVANTPSSHVNIQKTLLLHKTSLIFSNRLLRIFAGQAV